MSTNRLALETSPYLLQHKDNPVHWWAWGPEALAEAKKTGKPILLSVGYAACHWCHVMAHESFEDEPTAQLMNDLYVNIKVDREERPDIDALYMSALMRFNEQGGWPLTMFLVSEARPFWGGTYFPKQSQYGRPAFATVLLQIAQVFQNEPEKVQANAERIMMDLAQRSGAGDGRTLSDLAVKDLTTKLARAVDREHGGLSGAPNSRNGMCSGCCGGRPCASMTTLVSKPSSPRCETSVRAAFTITLAADFRAIRSMRFGWFRTLKKCSTTTRF